MRRCKICDVVYDDSNSFSYILDSKEDTCKICEDVIMDTLADFGLEDEDEEEGEEDAPEG